MVMARKRGLKTMRPRDTLGGMVRRPVSYAARRVQNGIPAHLGRAPFHFHDGRLRRTLYRQAPIMAKSGFRVDPGGH
jgi:hypothetical protein